MEPIVEDAYRRRGRRITEETSSGNPSIEGPEVPRCLLIGRSDFLIAVFTVVNQGTLVMRNRKDFGQVPGLREDSITNHSNLTNENRRLGYPVVIPTFDHAELVAR